MNEAASRVERVAPLATRVRGGLTRASRLYRRHELPLLLALTAAALGLLAAWAWWQFDHRGGGQTYTWRSSGQLRSHFFSADSTYPLLRVIDPLFLSGCLAVLAGLWLSRGDGDRFRHALMRLRDRAVLTGPEPAAEAARSLPVRLESEITRLERLSGAAAAAAIAAVMVALFIAIDHDASLFSAVVAPLVGLVAGAIAGYQIGRILSHGFLGWSLDHARVRLDPKVGALDGAAGLKPLGDYVFSYGRLLAIPVVFLVFWTSVIFVPYWTGDSGLDACVPRASIANVTACLGSRYAHLQWWYLALSLLSLILVLGGSALALARVHHDMAAARSARIIDAERDYAAKSAELEALTRPQIPDGGADATDAAENARAELRSTLEDLAARWQEAEAMPVWPFDRRLKRQITRRAAILASPLITNLVGVAVKKFFPS
jgi:hypothetical protein